MINYVRTTGVIFALIVVAHVWRIFAESSDFLRDPSYLLLTGIAAALSAWAFIVLRRAARP